MNWTRLLRQVNDVSIVMPQLQTNSKSPSCHVDAYIEDLTKQRLPPQKFQYLGIIISLSVEVSVRYETNCGHI